MSTGTSPAIDKDQPRRHWTADHAHRYLLAVHGESVAYKAPETFANLVERWIWAVGAGDREFADEIMQKIERMATEDRGRRT